MAGLKKNKRNKDSSSPNLVLVLFLVVFVISNIILGLWLYFNQAEVTSALAAKTRAEKEKQGDKLALEMYQTAADDFRQALGTKIVGEDLTALELKRKELLAGKYDKLEADKKNLEAYKQLIASLRGDLGFDDNGGAYSKTYKDEAAKALKERDDAVGTLAKVQKQLKEAQDVFKTLEDKQDKYFADTTAKLNTDQKGLTKIANTQSEEMKKQIAKNDELREAIAAADAKRADQEKNYKKQLKELEQVIADKDKDRSDSAVAARDNREPHALLLDISMGKPLWDDPVGALTRVDYKAKEATINIGSAKGVRPDLTFNVFAPSKYLATRAEKQLKGTLEVVRVLGPHTSIARITSTFDPDFPMHEGDLLFNLFWGTRVAIAGYVDVMAAPTQSPSEQMRQLNDFMYLLSRQGIIIDAYLDLTDGQVKGAVTQNTRYLIRGDDLTVDPKELENKEPRAERAVAVNNGAIAMRKDAIEKGIFIISARNFATLIGHHRASTGAKDQAAFRPQLPTAGTVAAGLSGGVGAIGGAQPRIEAAPPMPMPAPEPKEKADPKEKAEPKEKEKG